MEQFTHILLAIAGLGFLVFIHELGHFLIARREGMKVEAFSIGFGHPIYSWTMQGVRWQICWLPFGGYVKIAGMQREGSREPYEITDGFYSKSPMQRIRVALAGPLVNIAFALVAFSALWLSGGREKHFEEFTHRIGWVDPKSELYAKGVRPGDVIETYDGRHFEGVKDLMLPAIMKEEINRIQGYKIDYFSGGRRTDFDYTLKTEKKQNPKLITMGALAPAQYLIFENHGQPLAPNSPAYASGIENGDRILWANGELIFSAQQLSSVINESTAFLTVRRGSTVFQTKVPRVQFNELKTTPVQKAEMDDWQHEAGLKGRVQDLFFIPYLLSPDGTVELRLNFLDERDQRNAFGPCERCAYFQPLEENDVIIAIDGKAVDSSYALLPELQTRHALLIVQRDPAATGSIRWDSADRDFEDLFDPVDLESIVSSIGTSHPVDEAHHLVLLQPIIPKTLINLPLSSEHKSMVVRDNEETKKRIEAIEDSQKREVALRDLERRQSKVLLGIPFRDREVVYNPTPFAQFEEVLVDTWRTLKALFTGQLSPKYLSGPVGIVQVVHTGWSVGVKEAVFWMALISLNLGIVNLLPIPVLDGGHIAFSLFEATTRRRLSSKVMERLIIPFVGLLIFFFIYVTYQDIARIVSRFF
jgi:regulator of sigma E protease